MILCILGFSASGKDAVSLEIINKLGFTKIVQHTTRPRRESETLEFDYNFISIREFEKGIANQEFVSSREFNTIEGKWYYGIKKDAVNLNEKEILILDIEGLIELKRNIGSTNILSVFIDVGYDYRLERVKNRIDVDLVEFKRRAIDDELKKGLIINECNATVKNIQLDKCILEIQKIIEAHN